MFGGASAPVSINRSLHKKGNLWNSSVAWTSFTVSTRKKIAALAWRELWAESNRDPENNMTRFAKTVLQIEVAEQLPKVNHSFICLTITQSADKDLHSTNTVIKAPEFEMENHDSTWDAKWRRPTTKRKAFFRVQCRAIPVTLNCCLLYLRKGPSRGRRKSVVVRCLFMSIILFWQ